MVIGFHDSPEKPLRLAKEIHKSILRYNKSRKSKNKISIRIGIDTGPVYVFKDLTGRENIWGEGIIMTRRVMDLGGDMQIFASERIAQYLRKLSPDYKKMFHRVGDYLVKHGEKIPLYNVYGSGFGSKIAPRKGKILKTKQNEANLRGTDLFEFATVEIELDVKDPKTMLTHHTWLWNIINISKEPKDQFFYWLDGDVPKKFEDMNVKVTDEEGNVLDIFSLSVNKPTHKEFYVKFKKPLKPRQRNRYLKLEYDWEEPERNFNYKMATNCKNFKYKFSIPKGIEIKNRILKVDTDLGYKWHASPPPTIKYLPDRTTITWEAKNLKAFDAYRFEW